jgi:hypothetical protein
MIGYLIGDTTTDPTIGAKGVNRSGIFKIGYSSQGLIGQGTGWTIGHTLSTGDTRRFPHGLIHIKGDFGMNSFISPTDHLIDLKIGASPNATIT